MGQGQAVCDAPDPMEILRAAGTALNGRRLEDVCEIDTEKRPIGTGSFGTVWRGELTDHSLYGTTVAVKAVDKFRMKEMSVPHSMLLLEVELMRECAGSSRFVQLHDFLDTRGMYYLVLEFCDGGNLEDAVLHGRAQLGEKQVVRLMTQMLEGIAALHSKSICHRDVKPQNFMVVGDAGKENVQVKLGDFGLAVRLPFGELVTKKVGTPAFMAPEMHSLPAGKGYDHKVDVWAIGIVMVFLLVHHYPFVDDNGNVLHEKLARGELQLWETDVFSGALQAFQWMKETVGISRRRPSPEALHLVHRLLMPKREYRFSASGALHHDWFLSADAVQHDADRPDAKGEAGQGIKCDTSLGLFNGMNIICCHVAETESKHQTAELDEWNSTISGEVVEIFPSCNPNILPSSKRREFPVV